LTSAHNSKSATGLQGITYGYAVLNGYTIDEWKLEHIKKKLVQSEGDFNEVDGTETIGQRSYRSKKLDLGTLEVGHDCEVMLLAETKSSYKSGSRYIVVMDDSGTTYNIDAGVFDVVELAHWTPTRYRDMKRQGQAVRRQATVSALANMAVGSKVVVTAPNGSITKYGSKNVIALGGEEGTVVVTSFLTEKQQAGTHNSNEHSFNITRTETFNSRDMSHRTSTSGIGTWSSKKGSEFNLDNLKQVNHISPVAQAIEQRLDAYLRKLDKSAMRITGHSTVTTFEVHTARSVHSLSLSSSGQTLAMGGANKEVQIIDTSRGKQEVIQRLSWRDSVHNVSLCSTGKRVAVSGTNQKVSVLDVATGCELFQLTAGDRVRSIDISLGGTVIVCGGFDKQVRLCSTISGATMNCIPGG